MDLTNIATFLHVVDCCNYSKAAEDLGYAQSTVTSQIHALEAELGAPLFERIGRKNHLTDAGKEFLQYALDIQYALNKIKAINQDVNRAKMVIRIGIMESLLFSSMLSLIPKFRETYENITLSVKVSTADELIEMLRQNQLDIVYVSNVLTSDPSLNCVYSKEETMVFASGCQHPLAKQTNINLTHVLRYPFLVTELSGYCYGHLAFLAKQAQIDLNITTIINDLDAISFLLLDNKSVSFLPKRFILSSHPKNNIVMLDVSMTLPVYYSQILIRKREYLSPAMQHLIFLIKNLNKG
jgi:DNA-binding transcriptional LysR family regulator